MRCSRSTTVATDPTEVVDDASAFLTPNMATLMGAGLITVNNATVDQAMGLVAFQDMAGVDNLDFSIAGDESLSDLCDAGDVRSRPGSSGGR